MNRFEFLQQVEKELAMLPEDERASAVSYLVEYFDDAGQDKEQYVIAELKSPRDVAKGIIDDFYKNNPNINNEPVKTTSDNENNVTNENKTSVPLWAIIVIIILASPFIISCFGAVFGIAAGIFGAFFGIGIAALTISAAGIAVIIFGIIGMFSSVLGGMLVAGIGLALSGAGLIIGILIIKFYVFIIPKIIRGIVYLCKLPFKKRINVKNGGVFVENV